MVSPEETILSRSALAFARLRAHSDAPSPGHYAGRLQDPREIADVAQDLVAVAAMLADRCNGATTCPDGYPIKGNAQSKIFHPPTSRVYAQTVAELCFANIEAAQAAGFTSPRNL